MPAKGFLRHATQRPKRSKGCVRGWLAQVLPLPMTSAGHPALIPFAPSDEVPSEEVVERRRHLVGAGAPLEQVPDLVAREFVAGVLAARS
jgi:hypothetical protein